MIPTEYNIKSNQNYYRIRALWKYRNSFSIRCDIRDAIKWIRLDIAEFKRWGN
jgi:hypothetical protein